MVEAIKNRGPGGQGSILFRQNLEYPRKPGQITYYPPEPSDDMRKQVRRDRGGGLATYIIGFTVIILGYLIAMDFSNAVEVYVILIPLLSILGLIFAIMYVFTNNDNMAKLSRTMPAILMVCLVLFYIISIISGITELSRIDNNVSDNAFPQTIDNLFMSLLNPAFFLMSAGLLACHTGGTMLWTSKKIMSEYIPGMIIIESSVSEPDAPSPEPAKAQEIRFEQAIPVSQEAPTNLNLCKHCNGPLEYIEQYDRYYCYECQEYAPRKM